MRIIRVALALAILVWGVACMTQHKEPETATAPGVAPLFALSAEQYQAGDYESSLATANESLAMLNRQLAIAHNNICSAHIGLQAYEQAIASCRESLDLAPGYDRARKNLAWAYERQLEQTPSAREYIELSLLHYQNDEMDRSIAAAWKALRIEPRNAVAYNNICSAHAKKGEWRLAISACESALSIAPGYELAQANLDWARAGLARSPEQGR